MARVETPRSNMRVKKSRYVVTLDPVTVSAIPTPAERTVIWALARYGTITEAAKALVVSRHTIDTHLDNLRHKTQLRFLPQLVWWATTCGWIGKDDDYSAAFVLKTV